MVVREAVAKGSISTDFYFHFRCFLHTIQHKTKGEELFINNLNGENIVVYEGKVLAH